MKKSLVGKKKTLPNIPHEERDVVLTKMIVYFLIPLAFSFSMIAFVRATVTSGRAYLLTELQTSVESLETHFTLLNASQTCIDQLATSGFNVNSYGVINDTYLVHLQTIANTTCGNRYIHVVTTDSRTNTTVPFALSGDMSKHAIAFDGSWHDYGKFTGDDGFDCWDLDKNRLCNLTTEDKNSDGVCDVLDCRGTRGDNGTTGSTGFYGYSTPIGKFVYSCSGAVPSSLICSFIPVITAIGASLSSPTPDTITTSVNATWLISVVFEATTATVVTQPTTGGTTTAVEIDLTSNTCGFITREFVNSGTYKLSRTMTYSLLCKTSTLSTFSITIINLTGNPYDVIGKISGIVVF